MEDQGNLADNIGVYTTSLLNGIAINGGIFFAYFIGAAWLFNVGFPPGESYHLPSARADEVIQWKLSKHRDHIVWDRVRRGLMIRSLAILAVPILVFHRWQPVNRICAFMRSIKEGGATARRPGDGVLPRRLAEYPRSGAESWWWCIRAFYLRFGETKTVAISTRS